MRKRFDGGKAGGVFLLLMLAAVSAVMLIPMVYAILSSLKPLNELWVFPPKFFVRNPTLQNYADLFTEMSTSWVPFSRYIFTTLLISAVGIVGHVIFASMCAFSLCKLRMGGSRVVFQIIVYSLMFSAAVTQIPNFLVIKTLGLIDSYAALILPAIASPLGLYLMKQFMETMIPDSMLEAARIDGASNFRIFWKIAMPMVKPAWLTLIIFSFQTLWATGPNVAIRSEELKTLNYAISQIVASGIVRAGATAASVVLMMAFPILVFVITQSNVVETMSTSGMKD